MFSVHPSPSLSTYMDNKFTQQIEEWLDSSAPDVRAGADLLLRLNRNQRLYQMILRKPESMMSKLEYELRKHLRMRRSGSTSADVVAMERTLLPRIAKEICPVIQSDDDNVEAQFRGRRADHDQLTAEVRALYDVNFELYIEMKQAYNTLLAMENAAPCDRSELLHILKTAESKYRANWDL